MKRIKIYALVISTIVFYLSPLSLFSQHNNRAALQNDKNMIYVEAEAFVKQTKTGIRKWHIKSASLQESGVSDTNSIIWQQASSQAYIQILPDTRITHSDKLIQGENFSGEPGKMGILHYKVNIPAPGRYYVWVRAYSTGSEDNSIHVGCNGKWPQSGQRMQWCAGKHQWTWASKQRTYENHCGIPGNIYLDITKAGENEILFSMREDGFRFDAFMLTPDINYIPQGNADQDRNLHAAVKKWELIDIPVRAAKKMATPFDISLWALFTHESGDTMHIPGFYNGNNEWVIRFSSARSGVWKYETAGDAGILNGIKGSVVVGNDAKEDQHGAVMLSPENPQRFAYEDGTGYFPMAFELDWLFALDAENRKDIPRTKSIISAISEHGFNKVIMNVYAYNAKWGERDKINPEFNFSEPTVFPFGGSNETPVHNELNVDFFKHLDRVMHHLNDENIVSHLMIYVWNKFVNWPRPGSAEDNRYFDYVVKRYQAFPNIIWDISKEALAYGMDDMDYIVERIHRLRALDAYNRLVTVHDYKFCRNYPGLVDFISVQEWRPNLYNEMREIVEKYPLKPVFNVEHGGYEQTMHQIFHGAYISPLVCLERRREVMRASLQVPTPHTTGKTVHGTRWFMILLNLSKRSSQSLSITNI